MLTAANEPSTVPEVSCGLHNETEVKYNIIHATENSQHIHYNARSVRQVKWQKKMKAELHKKGLES